MNMVQAQIDREKFKRKFEKHKHNFLYTTDDFYTSSTNNNNNLIKLTREKSLKIYFSKNLGTNTIGLFYNAAPRKTFVITPQDWSIILENKNIIDLHLNHGFDDKS
jgi:hypothetical protein